MDKVIRMEFILLFVMVMMLIDCFILTGDGVDIVMVISNFRYLMIMTMVSVIPKGKEPSYILDQTRAENVITLHLI